MDWFTEIGRRTGLIGRLEDPAESSSVTRPETSSQVAADASKDGESDSSKESGGDISRSENPTEAHEHDGSSFEDSEVTSSKPVSTLLPPAKSISTQHTAESLTAPSSKPSSSSLLKPQDTIMKPSRRREKVILEPGHSPLDWARLTAGGGDPRVLKGVYAEQFPMRVTFDELQKHKSPEDAWSAFNGRVYNITPYLKFHPGGVKELMRVAGRDGTKLFSQSSLWALLKSIVSRIAEANGMLLGFVIQFIFPVVMTHAWVNLDHMLDACLIGMLVT